MKFTQVESAGGVLFRAPETSSMRVRYSRTEDKQLKNTLLTFAEKNGVAVFFGIARCNLNEGDRFNRKRGKAIAASRLKEAMDEFSTAAGYKGFNMKVSGNMLRGICPLNRVKELITYFRSIDETIEEARQKIFAEFERLRAERKAKEKAERREAAEKQATDKVLGEGLAKVVA